MKHTMSIRMSAALALWAGGALAYDCSTLPEWKRQHYYLDGAQVQYQGSAYVNTAASSKRDNPADGEPWAALRCMDGNSSSDWSTMPHRKRSTQNVTRMGIQIQPRCKTSIMVG